MVKKKRINIKIKVQQRPTYCNIVFSFMLILLTIGVAFLASSLPDGLDHVSMQLGFSKEAVQHAAPMSGYTVPFLGISPLATMLASVVGILACYLIFRMPCCFGGCRDRK